jgi:hypothetical protein
MTIRRFERLVDGSSFKVILVEPVPIRRLRGIHSRLSREFTTAIVRCVLQKPGGG